MGGDEWMARPPHVALSGTCGTERLQHSSPPAMPKMSINLGEARGSSACTFGLSFAASLRQVNALIFSLRPSATAHHS